MERFTLNMLRSYIRNLLLSCDSALSQLEYLNIYMGRLSTLLTSWTPNGHIVGGLQLVQRQMIVQGLIDVYTIYCHTKQAESDSFLSHFDNHGDQRSDDEDNDDDVLHVSDDHVHVSDIGRMFSIDFCQFQRGC